MLDATTIYVLSVLFFATLIRSTLGFGEALVAVPLLALRTPIVVAAPLSVLVSVLVAAIIVIQDWRSIHVRSAGWLAASALCGIPFGLLLLTQTNDRFVKTLLGIVIAGFSLYSLSAKSRLHLEDDHWVWLLASGFCSGVLGGAYGMNGPPLAMYGALRDWSPQHFRATLQGYFLPVSLAGLVGYAATGLWGSEVNRYFVLALPGVLVAVVIGRAMSHRHSRERFFRVVYAALLAIGAIALGAVSPFELRGSDRPCRFRHTEVN
jgi:uncharacterized membrane protein YfcA